MISLTELQSRVLSFIQKSVRRQGSPPTYRDIAAHLGVDVRSAYQHVQALERKGVLQRSAGRMELLGEYLPPPGIPILGRVAAGVPLLATGNIEDYLDLKGMLDGEDMFMLRVKGDSMVEAGINDGDMVLTRSQPSVENGEIAVVLIGDEATVKKVRCKGGRIVLEPANPKYQPMIYGPGDDVRIAGKVLLALRQL